jgi:hypothetical protein
MKRVLLSILFCILIAGQFAYGQVKKGKAPPKGVSSVKLSADDYPSLLTQADEVNTAGITGDWEKLADLTHPKIVAMAGGKTAMMALSKAGIEQMASKGFEILSCKNDGVLQIERVGTEIFALIDTSMIMKIPDGRKIQGRSSLVGVSGDRGKTWRFISATNQERFKKMFPAAAVKIKVPPEQPPVFLENQ